MVSHLSSVPWHTPALWQEANTCLATAIGQNRPALAESRRLAHRIEHGLESIFPLMERLCRATCPGCTDVCCRRAWVWADFRDILFLHLAGLPVPGQQLLDRQATHCHYGSPGGCRLDRIRRPFVCTWYLCPAQTTILKNKPAERQRLEASLKRIKALRQTMEKSFIRAVT